MLTPDGQIRQVGTVFADALAPHAIRFGFRRDDGLALLRWFLDLTAAADAERWLDEAHSHVERADRRGSTLHRYAEAARRSLLRGEQRLDEAVEYVRLFIGPLLDYSAQGRWEPHAHAWVG